MSFYNCMTGTPDVPSTLRSSFECDMDENFSLPLKWTGPNYTGGPNVEIICYTLTVTEHNRLSYEMNVTTTNTTITGLNCSSSYSISLRAVNCVGMGGALVITINPPGECEINIG